MSRTAVLTGATGLVGAALLRQLEGNADYTRVHVLGRRAPAVMGGKVRFFRTDLSNLETLGEALIADQAFCCLGTTIRKAGSKAAFERVDYHMVVDFARAAKKAGARKFLVVSAAGASLKSPLFYPRVKAQMEKTVSAIGFEATHILRPSLLLGARQESRLAERISQVLAPVYAPVLRGPLLKYRPVSAEDVAATMVKLANSSGTGVHIHHLPLI